MTVSQNQGQVKETFAYDIFVSYAHADAATVNPLVSALRESGFKVFDAADSLNPGEEFAARIQDAINESSCVLVFLSGNFNKSEWCEKEINSILSLRDERLILPITLDDSPIPQPLRPLLYIRLDAVTQSELIEKTRVTLDKWAASRKELLENLSDEDLARRIHTQRSEKSFAVLFERYYSHLIRYAMTRLPMHDDAQDIAHATMVRCWELIGQYDPAKGPFQPWLFAIARRTMIDNQRRRLRDSAESTKLLARIEPSSNPPVSDLDTHDQLTRALDLLSPDERNIVTLIYLDGLSSKDVSDMLGLPISVVYSRSHRALKRLRNLLVHSHGE